jgi:hypothetical protein
MRANPAQPEGEGGALTAWTRAADFSARGGLLFVLVSFHDARTLNRRHAMNENELDNRALDPERQRELIRLWNRMRKAEGPIVEEIRIQILERFSEHDRARRAA